jgi:hypothetical protein
MSTSLDNYKGFEVGEIRPPSEASSLLLRVTRNCPWNNCTFCTLYKGKAFSIRPIEHVFADIDLIKKCTDVFSAMASQSHQKKEAALRKLREALGQENEWAFHQSINWYREGMKSIFLQDANSMILKTDNMVAILEYIKLNFGQIERITSYARSHTIARMSDVDLKRISDAGLNRIHIGMETASDEILNLINKGVDQATHILAGQKVKKTNMQLSEYFMPGLGGKVYSHQNAVETAHALNAINPDFIRIRTLAVTNQSQLFKDYQQGIFTRANDTQMVEELLLLTENLDGITSTIKSDHILNLLPEFEGVLPKDKSYLISILNWYLNLSEDEKIIYRIGRRTGIINGMGDLSRNGKIQKVEAIIKRNNINKNNVDSIVDELMKRFI